MNRINRQKSVTLKVYDEDEDMEDTPMIENMDSKERQLRTQLVISDKRTKVAPSMDPQPPQQVEIKASNLLWIKLVIEFFELSQLVTTEQESALKIEEFFCNIRRIKVRAKFLNLYYKHLGYRFNIKNIPPALKIKIASYLTPKELLTKLNVLSNDLRSVSQNPTLWRRIDIFAQKESSSALHKDSYLLQLIGRSN